MLDDLGVLIREKFTSLAWLLLQIIGEHIGVCDLTIPKNLLRKIFDRLDGVNGPVVLEDGFFHIIFGKAFREGMIDVAAGAWLRYCQFNKPRHVCVRQMREDSAPGLVTGVDVLRKCEAVLKAINEKLALYGRSIPIVAKFELEGWNDGDESVELYEQLKKDGIFL